MVLERILESIIYPEPVKNTRIVVLLDKHKHKVVGLLATLTPDWYR